MSTTAAPKAKIKKALQRLRVPFGFLFAIIFLVFARPSANMLVIGGVVALFGLIIRAWASGHIRKNQVLAVSGPYAFTRNPLYLGSFFLGVGFTVASGVWWLGLVFAVLFLGIYFPVMRVEAEELTAIFGDKYKDYASAVPLFFPFQTAFEAGPQKFEIELYMRYREYRAALGFAAAWGILALKVYSGINLW